MNTIERNELGELDHGTKAVAVADGSVRVGGIDIPEGWELMPAAVRKIGVNREFINRGTRFPAWKIEDERGRITLAFEVRMMAPPAMKSAHNDDYKPDELCGMAWLEVSGPLLILTTKE